MKRIVLLWCSLFVPFACANQTGATTGDEAIASPEFAKVADAPATSGWKSPPEDIRKIVYAPQFHWVWTAPTGRHMLVAEPVLYPRLEQLAAPMHKLAGIRVNPKINGAQKRYGGINPRLIRVDNVATTPIPLPKGLEIDSVRWTADGQRFALSVVHEDHIGLWLGSIKGDLVKVAGVALNPLLGSAVRWLPDQQGLLIRRIPKRGPAPKAPVIPNGPAILEAKAASARSTYEARNLLKSAHDDALFDYYTKSELVVFTPETNEQQLIGEAAHYSTASFSPDGKYILVERLLPPWSHEVAWWRFAHDIEVWNDQGATVAKLASLPVSDQVPVHGVPLGPRSISWRPTASHALFWVEALDGGNPVAEVSHRDRLMRLHAPFTGDAKEVFRAEHRILGWREAEDGRLMLTQRERIKRWRYVWLLDVDKGSSRLWFDRNEKDRYGDPGYALSKVLPNGRTVLRKAGNALYFAGSGATDQGDRPFLDLRDMKTNETKRLFRSDPERYEIFAGFVGKESQFILRSESTKNMPNYYLATLGEEIKAAQGEATRALSRVPITRFEDPAPQLRKIKKEIVRYKRNDGVPLSFTLHLPPGHEKGKPLPTVVYAYPSEYSSAKTAGQVRGSSKRFTRIYGPSHLYFLLRGYAVLDNTAMPMIGDPETTYDTFVPQLVADAEAAVAKAVEMGVADPKRIGVIGHSHGGLMVANLLAHTDLFRAGIARSGSYNKTNQPFGFQSERRSLFEARDVYINVSPTFFADKVNEPILIIHGDDDANPGTLTFQSKVFYEAVRGSGGTARLVLLPFEDHGYRARESVEHVLWEQLNWFDQHVKGADPSHESQ
jgi:dipeptidyl aminopeptidase/acylaminoacyl peptidase